MEKKKVVAVLHALGVGGFREHFSLSVAYVLYADDTVEILTGKKVLTNEMNYELNHEIDIIHPYTKEQARILLEAIRDGIPSNLK